MLDQPVRAADTGFVTAVSVECLRCGEHHRLVRANQSRLDGGECPRCGYVGWTPVRTNGLRALPAPNRPRLRLVSSQG